MKPPAVKYQRAGGREEAIALLDEHGDDAKLLAGGQSLIPLMSFRLAQPGVLIDLNPATDLDHVGEGQWSRRDRRHDQAADRRNQPIHSRQPTPAVGSAQACRPRYPPESGHDRRKCGARRSCS